MSTETPAEEKPPVLAIVNGCHPFKAKLRSGADKDVQILLIPISKVGTYLDLVGDMPKLVEFACSQEPGFADTLEDESLFEIDRLARKLNDPRIDRYLGRQQETVDRLEPLAAKVAHLTRSSAKA